MPVKKPITGEVARALFYGAYVLDFASRRQMPMWGKYVAGLFKFPIAGYTDQNSRTRGKDALLPCSCDICRGSTPGAKLLNPF
jgi:hypothetical protein